MQTFIILILIFIIVALLFFNKNKEKNDLNKFKEDIFKNLQILDDRFSKQLSNKNIESSNLFKNTTDTLDKKISNQNIEQLNILKNSISELENKLRVQSQTTDTHVKEIITRVSYLDNIKEQMSTLNSSVNNLETVLNDKKARGTFGELRLSQIFNSVFGKNNNIYEEQYMLSNSKRVDFILHAPYPIGDLPIDSKFPLENFINLSEATDENMKNNYSKLFKQDIKKHIDTIAEKYIIEEETSTQAIMFIPAESIFSEIHSNHNDLIQYSYDKKVWLTSPTTIMAILNLVLIVLKDIKRNESYDIMHAEILKLKQEFDRFETRWTNLSKHLDTVYKDTKEIDVTSKKLIKRFDDIEKVNINKEED